MEKLLAQLTPLQNKVQKFRGNTAKSISRLKSESEINARIKLLEQYWKEFSDVWSQIELRANEVEAFSDDEYYVAEGEFVSAMGELETLRKGMQPDGPQTFANAANGEQEMVHAPMRIKAIEPPTFSGDTDDWVSFRDLFTSTITNNQSLSEIHRLQYLQSACKGKALEVIKDIAITAGNFAVAWDALVRRYENERRLVLRLIDRLFDLPAMTRECPVELARLLDGTNQVLRALAVLKRPTNQWSDLLVGQLSRKIDFNIRMAWEMSIGTTTNMPTFDNLDTYLSGYLRSLETMRSVHSFSHGKFGNYPTGALTVRRPNQGVRAHVGAASIICPVCSGAHSLPDCEQFASKSVQERRSIVETHRVCFNCIASSNHPSRNCPSYVHCSVCRRHHHTLLHINEPTSDRPRNPFGQGSSQNLNSNVGISGTIETSDRPRNPFGQGSSQNLSSNICISEPNNANRGTLLPTAWVKVTGKNGRSSLVRALIDQGSEATLISLNTCQQLGITWTKSALSVTGIGGASAGKTFGGVQVLIGPTEKEGDTLLINALVLANITTPLPSKLVQKSNHPTLEPLWLADKQYWKPMRIDMLVGAAHIPNLLMNGLLKADGLVAQETIFGWILSGTGVTSSIGTLRNTCNHMTLDMLLTKFWEEEEPHTKQILSKNDEACENDFKQNTVRGEDGRYIVGLPFRDGDRELGESRNAAIRRFVALEKRGDKFKDQWNQYKEFIDTYLQLNHMEKVTEDEIETVPQCYLPHHAVFKPESTSTKLRVVFDASATTTNGKSLNNLLLTGPRLQDNLSAILLRWRMHRIALCADIEKMYRQIGVKREHWDYQRIVWRNSPEELISHFRLKTVTYGTASAPYLAVKTLQRLADDEQQNYPWASKVLKQDVYVDDCITGADTEEGAKELTEQLRNITRAGCFRLLKWSSNSKQVLEALPEDHIECHAPLHLDNDESIKALGIHWHPQNDDLSYKVQTVNQDSKAGTKRQVLSEIAKLFDPLGLLAPVIITAKSLMQQLWLTGVGWDDELPVDVIDKWNTFKNELALLEKFRITRWTGYDGSQEVQLHGFSDASQIAFAACVYAKTRQTDGTIRVSLLAAKTKVAPIKQQCIPRLELNGAVLLNRLLNDCQHSLPDIAMSRFAWTDSKVVLAWLHRHANVWPTYVANRVSEIQLNMHETVWQHVSGVDNPADVASRGLMPSKIQTNRLWWGGPAWLYKGKDEWPKQTPMVVDPVLLEEKHVKSNHLVKEDKMFDLAERYSSWKTLLRVTAYCLRVKKENRLNDRALHANEIKKARIIWLKLVQRFEFGDISTMIRKGEYKKLVPFVDEEGLVRVGGRLQNSNITYDEQHPIILSGKTSIVALIITDAHERVYHGGPQNTLGQLHQAYWLINGRRQVRALIHKCVICAKTRTKTQHQLMGNLPAARVQPSRPFLHTGIDYAGPIWSRTTKGRGHRATKSWIAVFICFSTKAAHFELVSDLTSAAFIAAFRRFTARRGRCSDVYCDNGSNFVGADRELQNYLRMAMQNEEWKTEFSNEGTRFHFSPPGSPHFNGLAESTVRMAKSAVTKTIGEQRLTFEEMCTLLYQIEAAINSRPLCALPTDGTDWNVLTPGHFLIGQPLTAVPESHQANDRISPSKRWKLVQHMAQQFWKRWSREYLHQMQQRQKWSKSSNNIKLGDIVIIRDESLIAKWRLGRVVEVHPGNDGHVRVASIKTANGTIRRAITKLCVLPIENNQSNITETI